MTFAIMEASTSTDRSSPANTISTGDLADFLPINYRREALHPHEYSLYYLAKENIPNFYMQQYKNVPSEFKEIEHWLHPNIFTHKKKAEKKSSEMAKVYKHENRKFIWVMFFREITRKPHEILTTRFFSDIENRDSATAKEYSSSMMIIPKNEKNALVYVFGHSHSKLNQLAIVYGWGLHIVTNKEVCGDDLLTKQWQVRNDSTGGNTRKKTVKSSKPAPIKIFTPNIGDEYFMGIRVQPVKNSVIRPTIRLMDGSDYVKFAINEVNSESEKDRCRTEESLINFANYYYGVSLKTDNIHPTAKLLIEVEVMDANMKKKLNDKLSEILTSGCYEEYFVDVSDRIFRHMGKWVQFSAENQSSFGHFTRALENATKKEGANVFSPIYVRQIGTNYIVEESIFTMIRALAVELGNTNDDNDENKEFYRFECGHWFVMPKSRFEAIEKNLVLMKTDYTECGLIPYAETKYAGTGDNKERAYNEDVVKSFQESQEDPSDCAILIDNIMISLIEGDGRYDKFEFGDIFVVKGGRNYIIHVKRISSSTAPLNHHCMQVVRCVEYLGRILERKNDWKILVQGCINSLYMEHGITREPTKNKGKGKGKGKSKDEDEDEDEGKAKTADFIKKIKAATRTQDTEFKKELYASRTTFLEKYKFFDASDPQCMDLLNALFDCDKEMQSKNKEFKWETAERSLNRLHQCLHMKNQLFHDGIIKEDVKNNTHIIMAFIDEKNTFDKFRKQTLPALALTISKVNEAGFKFGWTVVRKMLV